MPDSNAVLSILPTVSNRSTFQGDPDLFAPLLGETASRAVDKTYGADESTDVAIRRIAEHGRAMTMLVADGVLPSNEGRGYVLRRIIRRAILAQRRAGSDRPLASPLVDATIEKMGGAYPVLVKERDLIVEVLEREETGFARRSRQVCRCSKRPSATSRRVAPPYSRATLRSNCTTPTVSPSNSRMRSSRNPASAWTAMPSTRR